MNHSQAKDITDSSDFESWDNTNKGNQRTSNHVMRGCT